MDSNPTGGPFFTRCESYNTKKPACFQLEKSTLIIFKGEIYGLDGHMPLGEVINYMVGRTDKRESESNQRFILHFRGENPNSKGNIKLSIPRKRRPSPLQGKVYIDLNNFSRP